MKTIISLSAASTNRFLDPDGLLNVPALTKFQANIAAKVPTNLKGSVFYITQDKKKNGTKYSAALENKGDFKYRLGRALPVATRARFTSILPGKHFVLLMVPPRMSQTELLTEAQRASLKEAESAIKAHMRKSESSKAKVSKEKAAIRSEDEKIFNQSIDSLKELLLEGGLKESDMVVAQGMFGRAMLVKLSPTNVVSIGHSDMAKFRIAKRAAQETGA